MATRAPSLVCTMCINDSLKASVMSWAPNKRLSCFITAPCVSMTPSRPPSCPEHRTKDCHVLSLHHVYQRLPRGLRHVLSTEQKTVMFYHCTMCIDDSLKASVMSWVPSKKYSCLNTATCASITPSSPEHWAKNTVVLYHGNMFIMGVCDSFFCYHYL